jgi:thiamine biosynthesis lipoprotein
MGTLVRTVLYAPDEDTARAAGRAAFQRFADLEQIMSDYRPKSELSILCSKAGTGPQRVNADLYKVLAHGRYVSQMTGGAFDMTSSPIIRHWRTARKTGKMPKWQDLQEARRLTGWQKVILNGRDRTVALTVPGMKLDLGGIAKGYACDEALKAMKAHGVDRAMIQAGGDIAASGPPPDRAGWRVAISGSNQILTIFDQAVSTSGDSEQSVEIGGRIWSHIVDPRTGLAKTDRVQATVIADRGLVTDPLATALSVIGPVGYERLASRFGAQVVFVIGQP